MWLLTFIPHWAYYISLIFGVGASFINSRKSHVIGLILIAGSCWQLGGTYTESVWQARVTEMENRVAEATKASELANTKVTELMQSKVRIVKQKTKSNVEYITKYVAKDLDNTCTLTSASVLLSNSASQNEVPNSSTGVTSGTSEVKASEFLETVTENYGTYYQLVEQVKGWQNWYYTQKKIFEE